MVKVSYGFSENAWSDHVRFLQALIANNGTRSVLEVGGGANPCLGKDYIRKQQLSYTLLDVSQQELDKADSAYTKVLANIADPDIAVHQTYDLIFSKMLAEHISDTEQFHRNIFRLLNPGGYAFHFFPTLYAPPFVLNRILPERFSERLLTTIQPQRTKTGSRPKFPAYYRWCRGPTRKQIGRLETIGFEVQEYVGFFGHSGYYASIPMLRRMHERVARWLAAHPVAGLTSFAYVVMRKPGPV